MVKENKSEKLNLSLSYTIEIRDKDGKVIRKVTKESRSILKNFASMLRALMWGDCVSKCVTLKDIYGTNRDYPDLNGTSDFMFFVRSTANINFFGIVVGTGDTSVTRDDYKLVTYIEGGTGTGKLSMDNTLVEAVNGTPPESRWNVTRIFINQSGGTIIVKEIGIAGEHRHASDGQYRYYQMVRDVLAVPQTLLYMQQMTITYTWKVTA
mgnify:CR=1 FL=1